jgi:hypothetical protein
MDGMLRDSSVLVKSGAGFIGSNLVESLLLSGNFVVCRDNFPIGKRENPCDFTDNPNTLMNLFASNFSRTFEKAEKLPLYSPMLNVKNGLEELVKWLWIIL